MSKTSVATESIYGFASKQADVQPSEEPIFVLLSSSQLHELVFKAVQDALESQKSLHEIVQGQAKAISALNTKLEAIQKDMDSLASNDLNQLRLINDLRKDKEPQPLQRDRGEILRALLAANNGKMLAKEARQKMRLDEATFSRLLITLEEHIEKKAYHLDKRQSILIIK